jgi:hypothetical protein
MVANTDVVLVTVYGTVCGNRSMRNVTTGERSTSAYRL